MFKNFMLRTTTVLTSSMLASVAVAEQGATQILEEYFANFDGDTFSVEVGDKDDALRYTQWNNVILSAKGEKFQVAMPFIRVDKKLLGGHELSYSPSIKGTFQSPDPKIVDPIEFIIQNQGVTINVTGSTGARTYETEFDQVSFTTLPHPSYNIEASAMNGTSTQTFSNSGDPRMSGKFESEAMNLTYKITIDGEEVTTSNGAMQGLSGSYDFPFITEFDPDNPAATFDPKQTMAIDYALKSATTNTTLTTPIGPIDIQGAFGRATGSFGMKDSNLVLSGDSYDVTYKVDAAGLGMPSADFAMKAAVANIILPIGYQGTAKPARYKMTLQDLTMSESIWEKFDPTRILPRDPISLDIDLGAQMRWLRTLLEIENLAEGEAPIAVESAEITSLLVKGAGAEIDATGKFLFDNSTFPPQPHGTIDASVTGSQALVEKLAKIGLIPPQSVMMAKGISAMFFQQGTGADHLTTVLEFAKDGSIKANGMPVK